MNAVEIGEDQTVNLTIRQWCAAFDEEATKIISSAGLLVQPDSRAYGAHVEKAIRDDWVRLSTSLGYTAGSPPGRRTIYDMCCERSGSFIGLDIKSRDLSEGRYSDGGICSVGNLLRYYQNDPAARFIVAEFGYRESNEGVTFEYVRSAPLHALPASAYRIENLGTGQVRINDSIRSVWADLDWDRTVSDFHLLFCRLAEEHFQKVSAVALGRAAAIDAYVESGFRDLSLK